MGLGAREAGRLANCPGLWLATHHPLDTTEGGATAEEPRSLAAQQDAGSSRGSGRGSSQGSGRAGGERARVAAIRPGF